MVIMRYKIMKNKNSKNKKLSTNQTNDRTTENEARKEIKVEVAEAG